MTSETTVTFKQIYDIQKTVADLFIRHKQLGCCLVSSILLKEILESKGIPAKLVKGWRTFNNIYAQRHYWIQVHHYIFDIGSFVFNSHVFNSQLPENRSMLCTLEEGEILPNPTLFRVDNETAEELKELEELENGYKMYTTKHLKQYLKKSPEFIQRFAIEHTLIQKT
jgi:hypothetical protein